MLSREEIESELERMKVFEIKLRSASANLLNYFCDYESDYNEVIPEFEELREVLK